MKVTILKTKYEHMVFNTYKYRCKCMHYTHINSNCTLLKTMNENQDSMEKLLILGLGQRKHNKPHTPCDRLRNCSDNNGDMSKDIEATQNGLALAKFRKILRIKVMGIIDLTC